MSHVAVIRLRRGDDTVTVNADDVATQSTFIAEGWSIDGATSVAAPSADSGKPKTRILDARALPTIVVRRGDEELVVNATEEAEWASKGFAVVGNYEPTLAAAKAPEKNAPPPDLRARSTVQLWLDGDFVVVNDTAEDRFPWLARGYGEDPQTMSVERAAKLAAEAEANAKKKGK